MLHILVTKNWSLLDPYQELIIPDPDPAIISDPTGSGSTTLLIQQTCRDDDLKTYRPRRFGECLLSFTKLQNTCILTHQNRIPIFLCCTLIILKSIYMCYPKYILVTCWMKTTTGYRTVPINNILNSEEIFEALDKQCCGSEIIFLGSGSDLYSQKGPKANFL